MLFSVDDVIIINKMILAQGKGLKGAVDKTKLGGALA